MSGPAARTDLGQGSGHGLVLSDDTGAPRALAFAYTRYLAASCRRFLAAGPELPAVLRPAHATVAGLVRQGLEGNQAPMLACFTSAAVGTPLQCVGLREELEPFRARIDAAAMHIIPHLLLEMGLRQLIPAGQSVLWEHDAPRLASLAIGGALFPPEAAFGLRFSASHLAAVGHHGEVGRLPMDPAVMRRALAEGNTGFRFARCFRRTGADAYLATIDHNPLAAFEAHPDKAGNHIDLGGRSVDEWVAVLEPVLDLIERFLPGEFAEMEMLLHEIIPVGYDGTRHLSASYREAVGTIYLTLHPNPMTMAEAVLHEFQHNKLNVSAYSVEYLTNAFHPLYKSPVRPDPRPLWGILLAVHAFLPITELYRRMRNAGHAWATRPDFEQRMSEVDLKNHEGMEMLRAHARFTPAGRGLFDDLERLERGHMEDRKARGLETTPTASHLS